jgi:hypothetical protein
MDVMGKNRGPSGRSSSFLLWALLGMVVGMAWMCQHLGLVELSLNFPN